MRVLRTCFAVLWKKSVGPLPVPRREQSIGQPFGDSSDSGPGQTDVTFWRLRFPFAALLCHTGVALEVLALSTAPGADGGDAPLT